MPAATTYWSTIDPMRDLKETANQERRDRADWHKRAWQYYDGLHPLPLVVKHGTIDNNVIVNLVRQAAEHTLSFAVPSFPQIEVDMTQETTTEETIEAMWEEIGEATWLNNAMLIGILEGHVFVRIMPPDATHEYPRPIVLNPANVLCYWSDDDYERPLWYELTYQSGEKRKQDVLSPGLDGNIGWQIREYNMRQNEWQLINVLDWPYECAPIIDWQHLPRPMRYYGDHELQNLRINDAVNKVASDIKSILRIHAAPRMVGFGFDAQQLQDTGIGAFWAIPQSKNEADIKLLEMQSDLASSMHFMDTLIGSYMHESRVTLLTGGPDAYKGVTNLGIKAAFMSQLAKTETLHRQYGKALAEITEALCEMIGITIDCPKVVWAQALPVSEAEQTQTVQQQVDMGLLSKQTAASLLDIDWEVEQERLAAEGDQQGAMMDRLMAVGGSTPFDTPFDQMRRRQMQPMEGMNGPSA